MSGFAPGPSALNSTKPGWSVNSTLARSARSTPHAPPMPHAMPLIIVKAPRVRAWPTLPTMEAVGPPQTKVSIERMSSTAKVEMNPRWSLLAEALE